jgi:hypothetical protein
MALSMELPKPLAEVAAEFPETSYGACKATLILRCGRKVSDVTLAWGREIVKIGSKPIEEMGKIDFAAIDIVGVQKC